MPVREKVIVAVLTFVFGPLGFEVNFKQRPGQIDPVHKDVLSV